MFTKEDYELAKKNGLLERFRSDMISKRIAKRYPLNSQIAVDKNIIKDLMRGTKEHYAEWEAYEAYRDTVKAEVDEILAGFETGEIKQTEVNTDGILTLT